jgi:hypothetical protein
MKDLRTPIGIFFLLSGAILAITGMASSYRAPLETANVNLYCGISMLVFGGIMLWLSE